MRVVACSVVSVVVVAIAWGAAGEGAWSAKPRPKAGTQGATTRTKVYEWGNLTDTGKPGPLSTQAAQRPIHVDTKWAAYLTGEEIIERGNGVESYKGGRIEIGAAGKLLHPIVVLQVISKRECLARVCVPLPSDAVYAPGQKGPGPHIEYKVAMMITGISTEGYTDGSVQTLGGIFKVVGTKTYPTALGATQTVFQLTPAVAESRPASGPSSLPAGSK